MSVLSPTPEAIAMAGKVIRDGGVVVMPTETVYGLACNGLNPEAVKRVFEIKSRPSENPLILHLASLDQLGLVASSWPPLAEKLALIRAAGTRANRAGSKRTSSPLAAKRISLSTPSSPLALSNASPALISRRGTLTFPLSWLASTARAKRVSARRPLSDWRSRPMLAEIGPLSAVDRNTPVTCARSSATA